jgi:hypothetical protein
MTQDTMRLVARLKHVALANKAELPIDLSGWTASPLSVSSSMPCHSITYNEFFRLMFCNPTTTTVVSGS